MASTSSGSSEYFSGSLLAISSSFLETQTWLLPRQKAWQGRQVPPPTAEPTNRGRHCSQWLPWKPGKGWSEQVVSGGSGGAGSEQAASGSTMGVQQGLRLRVSGLNPTWVQVSPPPSRASDLGCREGDGVLAHPARSVELRKPFPTPRCVLPPWAQPP